MGNESNGSSIMAVAHEGQRRAFRDFLANGGAIIGADASEIVGEDWIGGRCYTPDGGLTTADYLAFRDLLDPISLDFLARGVMDSLLMARDVPYVQRTQMLDEFNWAVQSNARPVAYILEEYGFEAVADAVTASIVDRRAISEDVQRHARPNQTVIAPIDPRLSSLVASNCRIARSSNLCPAQRTSEHIEEVVMIPASVAKRWKVAQPTPPRKRGAPRQYDPAADRRLLQDWKSAKSHGVTRKEFARQKGIDFSDLTDALNRERKRRPKPSE